MKKIRFRAALLVGVLIVLLFPLAAMSFSHVIFPGNLPDPNIEVETANGSLTKIEYYVSSTGATSGIRYQTLWYYITLRDNYGNPVATFSFQPTTSSPPPGQTIIDKFTITAQDLLNAGFTLSSLRVENFSQISLSAKIRIYNANSGATLTTFGDANSIPDTIYPVIEQQAGAYGFPQQDINDMKSRYVNLSQLAGNPDPGGGGGTCSLDIDSPVILEQEQVSGYWSFDYWSWVTHSSTSCYKDENGKTNCDTYYWDVCEITSTQTGPYHEKLWMEVSQPDPATVKAGQGTSIIVTTYYENNDPSAWNGSSYTNGVQSVSISGPLTDDWQAYKLYGTRTTENMILLSTDVYWNYYRPQNYSTGCNGGQFSVGYNVPVEVKTWIIPYARFDKDNGWTRHQTLPTDIDNLYVFGGLNRWYFGFDIPDNETFNLQFLAHGGVNNMSLCDSRQITIYGSPYDDIVIRSVDPRNPFPGGVPENWKGYEHHITALVDWYIEPQVARQRQIEEWKNMSFLQMLYNYINDNIIEGIKNIRKN
jgi:hypothetical protein